MTVVTLAHLPTLDISPYDICGERETTTNQDNSLLDKSDTDNSTPQTTPTTGIHRMDCSYSPDCPNQWQFPPGTFPPEIISFRTTPPRSCPSGSCSGGCLDLKVCGAFLVNDKQKSPLPLPPPSLLISVGGQIKFLVPKYAQCSETCANTILLFF